VRRSATEDDVGQDTDIIALVGAGERGTAILAALLRVPGVEVRYVVDGDPDAPGLALAREHGIACRPADGLDELAADGDLDLIVETSGDPAALATLRASGLAGDRLLSAAGSDLVVRLLAELSAVVDRANADKARYLRQASHQVKSPLSSIETYVGVVLGGYTGEIPERTREVMEKIRARCDAALAALAKRRLLADLRCTDRGDLETSTVRLGELLDRAVEQLAALAAAREVAIEVAPGHGPGLVRCDPDKTVALLRELLENAVVYSTGGGAVEAAVTTAPGDRLAVTITDHGIGIPARCLPRIFDEDYRADTAVKHYPDGAGLGLAVAREIATLQGFELAAASEEGQGSVFTLNVPSAPAA
jgi:signal transduction histidine kinase